LTVLAISLTTFNNSLNISETAALVADANENLRTGLNFLTRDLIQTGGGIPTGGVPIPSGAGSIPIARPGPPGTAYTFNVGDTLPALTPGATLGPLVAGQQTDIVTMIYQDISVLARAPVTNEPWMLNSFPLVAIAADGSRATVDPRTPITNPDSAVMAGDLIMFSNALGNTLQEVTGTDGAQIMFFDQGDPLQLNQPGAAEGNIVNLQSSPGQYPPTTATRVIMASYYIDASSAANPRLVRAINARTGLAIGMGIENFQLSYDLVDGVNNPTNVKTPVAPNSPNQIRKVNIYMLGRSEDRHRATNLFFRNSLTTQVSLRSLSFVDRYR
jgi:hypothetical protein